MEWTWKCECGKETPKIKEMGMPERGVFFTRLNSVCECGEPFPYNKRESKSINMSQLEPDKDGWVRIVHRHK